jgi:hypothetical protein
MCLHVPGVALQGKAAAAERRAADLDSQLLLLGRALREAEGAALDWQARAGRADAARHELGGMVEGNEAAVKQVGRLEDMGGGSCSGMWMAGGECFHLQVEVAGAALRGGWH